MATPARVDPRHLLAAPFAQLRRRPLLCLGLGLLGAGSNVLLRAWAQQALRPSLWRAALEAWMLEGLMPWQLLFGSGAAFILFSLLGWLLALVAEGALIATTLARAGHPPARLRQWLARFIAVDTLVFVPLFLLTLLALLLLIGVGTGSLLAAMRSEDPRTILGSGLGLLLLCMVPLLILGLPLAFLTLVLRLLAFRAVALEDLGARAALRRVWRLLRTPRTGLVLYAFILLGLASLAGTLAGLPSLLGLAPLLFGLAGEEAAATGGGWLLAGAGLLLELALRAPWFAFAALAWTQAYRLAAEAAR